MYLLKIILSVLSSTITTATQNHQAAKTTSMAEARPTNQHQNPLGVLEWEALPIPIEMIVTPTQDLNPLIISTLSTPQTATPIPIQKRQDWQSVVSSAESLASSYSTEYASYGSSEASHYSSYASSVVSSAESVASAAASGATSTATSTTSSASGSATSTSAIQANGAGRRKAVGLAQVMALGGVVWLLLGML